MFPNFGTKLIFLIENSFFFQIKRLSNIITGVMKKMIGVFCHQKYFDFCSEFFGLAIISFAIAFLEPLFANVLSDYNFLTATVKQPFLEISTRKLCSHQEIYPGFLIAFVCKIRNCTFIFLPHFSKFSNLFIYYSPFSKKIIIYQFEVSFKTIGNNLSLKCIKNWLTAPTLLLLLGWRMNCFRKLSV